MRNTTQEQQALIMHPETIPSVLISSMMDPGKVNVAHHRAYMPSALEDYQPLVPVLDTLYNANPEDTITLILNGDGGYVTTSAHMSTAIARSQAVVIAEAYGRTSSAHTLTMLSADIVLPVRNTLVMVHNMSMSSGGSGEEPIKHVQASLDWCYSLFEEHQLPFLSLEELESIFNHNSTLWLSKEEDINNRIFTTMWYRAAMGVLKPEAFNMFIELVQAGTYSDCSLVNINTLIHGLEDLDPNYEADCSSLWAAMERAGLLGEFNTPIDFVLSLS